MEKLKHFMCFIFGGHKYRIVQHFSRTSRRVKCDRCKGDWGMNDDVQAFLPWDTEIEEMYSSFGNKINEPIYGYKETTNGN